MAKFDKLKQPATEDAMLDADLAEDDFEAAPEEEADDFETPEDPVASLDKLATEYPELADKVEDLKADLEDLMAGGAEEEDFEEEGEFEDDDEMFA